MGTSLSGLTPATTFDGLLKVGDNDPLTADLKAISTGDGTDTILSLSTGALQIGGATGMYWDNTNKRLGIGTDSPLTPLQVNGAIRSSGTGTQTFEFSAASLAQFRAIFGSVGFRVSNGVFIGGADGGPSANTRLHVKGSGSSAATASLLVQNSSGNNLINAKDDGEVTIGSAMQIKGNDISAYNSINLKTYTDTGWQSNLVVTGNGASPKVGIGETTPTARLHIKGDGTGTADYSFRVQNAIGNNNMQIRDDGAVFLTNNRYTFNAAGGAVFKGSGATSATTALLVQNSAGTELFKVQDDGATTLNGFTTIDVGNGDPAANNGLYFGNGKIKISNYFNQGILNVPTGRLKLMSSEGVSIGTNYQNTQLTAMLSVKGLGNDATTTALLVQNSTGDDMLRIMDGGADKVLRTSSAQIGSLEFVGANIGRGGGNPITFAGTNQIGMGVSTPTSKLHIQGSGNSSATNAFFVENSTGNDLFRVVDNGLIYMSNDNYIFSNSQSQFNNKLGIGTTPDSSAQLHVKGSGATSATTALLVQNSAGTDLLKVQDDGGVLMSANKFQIQAGRTINYTPVGVGGASVDNSAVLQANSTTKGFLPPRMTDAEKNAIATPAAGLMVYDTDANQMSYWNGGGWVNF